jgi:hypothetical protein
MWYSIAREEEEDQPISYGGIRLEDRFDRGLKDVVCPLPSVIRLLPSDFRPLTYGP